MRHFDVEDIDLGLLQPSGLLTCLISSTRKKNDNAKTLSLFPLIFRMTTCNQTRQPQLKGLVQQATFSTILSTAAAWDVRDINHFRHRRKLVANPDPNGQKCI